MIKECEVMNGDKKRALKRVIVVSISLVILASMIVPTITPGDSMAIGSENDNNDYIARDSIRINGNTDFAEQAAAEGWPGDGSKEEPYIIRGYEIDGYGHGSCIFVGNTTLHFELIDNYVHTATGKFHDPYFSNTAILLHNLSNSRIINNKNNQQ